MPPAPSKTANNPLRYIANQPYLLLSLTSLFWASNMIVGRYVVGQIPPITLSLIRWGGALLIVLPWALPHFKRDWPTIRAHLPMLVIMSICGISIFNTAVYWALEYTQALNGLLLQSSSPLFIALWSLLLLRVRLTLAQAIGIFLSMSGVIIILLRGDPSTLTSIEFNKGDIILVIAFIIFALYTTLAAKIPKLHPLSFLAFTFGCGVLGLLPFGIWEYAAGRVMTVNHETVLAAAYIVLFPATFAYLCYNRGIQLVGANRAAPFSHLIPVFGSMMAIGLLGEKIQAFHLIGYVLVFSGVVIAARRPRQNTDGKTTDLPTV